MSMATSAILAVLQKARNATQEEIDRLCDNISELLTVPDKSPECCELLRQLFLILQVSESNAEPSIPKSLVQNLFQNIGASAVQRAPSGKNKCMLCHMIISELTPEQAQLGESSHKISGETGSSSLSTMMLLQGKRQKCLQKMLPEATRWLQSQDPENQKAGLVFLTSVSILHAQMLTDEATIVTSERLAQWLSSASLMQAPNPHAINPFRKDEDNRVTEMDGTPNSNIFTVLNIGQYYTDDQFLNILSFSTLYKFLLGVYVSSQSNLSNDESATQSLEEPKQRNESTKPIKMDNERLRRILETLLSKSVDYCFRVIDQCERKAKVQSDTELQVACLIEAVQVLDIICTLDKEQTARIFQEVKRLNTRLTQERMHSPVLIYILKFFFHHSTSVVHDPQETYKYFFSTVVSKHFKDQGTMYDVIEFLTDNQMEVAESTSILTDYFPNLFKVVAWHPRVFFKEFIEMLPTMMNWETSVEIFHTLLDLPCLTAALEVMEKAARSEMGTLPVDAEPTSSLEAYHSVRYRPLFNYITRSDSGQGDTIDRLSNLHSVLKDCLSGTRVMVCAQLVPVFIKIWFDTVMESEDAAFVSQLIPVIIERSGIMVAIPELVQDVHRVFADKLLVLCHAYPEVVITQQSEIVEFLQTTANLAGRVGIYSNLIYVVGEYTSPAHSSECSPEVIGKYYESLELVTYELLGHLVLQEHDSSLPKVVSTLIAAISKLASRCQDLIPRAILCLTKAAKQQNLAMLNPSTQSFLANKATSLIAVLKDPDTATSILSPKAEIYSEKWHLNNTSVASIMRGINRLLRD